MKLLFRKQDVICSYFQYLIVKAVNQEYSHNLAEALWIIMVSSYWLFISMPCYTPSFILFRELGAYPSTFWVRGRAHLILLIEYMFMPTKPDNQTELPFQFTLYESINKSDVGDGSSLTPYFVWKFRSAVCHIFSPSPHRFSQDWKNWIKLSWLVVNCSMSAHCVPTPKTSLISPEFLCTEILAV